MAIKKASSKYPGIYINEYKNGNTAYYINYRAENGKPTLKKVGLKTKQSNFTIKDAYDKLIEAKHLIRTNEELPKLLQSKKKVSFDDIFKEYEKWAKNNKKSHSEDTGVYNNHLIQFANKDIKSLKPHDFEELKQQKLKILKPRTVENILALARHIINFAINNELVKNCANPLSNGKVRMPTVDNKMLGFLTKEEAKLILDTFKAYENKRLYQLTALMLFTGARFIEIASLEWGNINFKTNLIYFKKTKNGNDRYIKMTKRVLKVIKKLKKEMNDTKLIIPTSTGTKYIQMPKQWQNKVDILIKNNVNLGRNRITTHSLRHTHASWLAQAKVDILFIKEQLGHKKIETTMRYAHLIENKRHKATLKLGF
ncbi:MAG: site-specific integrase [Epsilonproteobacteria bacterium]|nr:MAG: site-specific integrase [Campylobacterota bacterium]